MPITVFRESVAELGIFPAEGLDLLFACVTCYEMLRFSAFSKIWETMFSTQVLDE